MASVRRKNKRSFEIRVSDGSDINGKQIVHQMTWKPEPGMTDKQIKKELNRQVVMFEEKIKAGKYPCNVTFMAFAEDYRENYAKGNLRPTSFEKETYITKRVYAAIGHKKLGKITRRDIIMFVNDLVKNGKNEKTGKPLAYKTIKSHVSFVSRVFSYAIELGALSDNPARNIKIPKTEENKPKEVEIYDPEELRQLVKMLDDKVPMKYKMFVNLLIIMGGRKGEVLGLEWKDIDFRTRLITIRRASYYTPEEGIFASDLIFLQSTSRNRTNTRQISATSGRSMTDCSLSGTAYPCTRTRHTAGSKSSVRRMVFSFTAYILSGTAIRRSRYAMVSVLRSFLLTSDTAA